MPSIVNQKNNQHEVGFEIKGVLIFVGAIWLIHCFDIFLPLGETLGLIPRYLSGIPGIATMTFLHKDFGHLIANTFPLIVLVDFTGRLKSQFMADCCLNCRGWRRVAVAVWTQWNVHSYRFPHRRQPPDLWAGNVFLSSGMV